MAVRKACGLAKLGRVVVGVEDLRSRRVAGERDAVALGDRRGVEEPVVDGLEGLDLGGGRQAVQSQEAAVRVLRHVRVGQQELFVHAARRYNQTIHKTTARITG